MASFDGNSRLQTPAIGDKPHQPSSFRFPKREFGNTLVMKRSFQLQWFDRWSWLHYEENLDLAFCFTCVTAYQNNLLQYAHCLEPTFYRLAFLTGRMSQQNFLRMNVVCDSVSQRFRAEDDYLSRYNK